MNPAPGARDYPHHFRPSDPAAVHDVPVVEGERTGLPRPPRPWYAQVAGQWPLFRTLLGVAAGLAVTGAGYWKRGTGLVGASFLLATLLRLFLPDRLVGLLGVRSRVVDTLTLAVLAVGTLVLALIVPPTQK